MEKTIILDIGLLAMGTTANQSLKRTYKMQEWPNTITGIIPTRRNTETPIPLFPSPGSMVRGFPLGSDHFFDFVCEELTDDMQEGIIYIGISHLTVQTGSKKKPSERWREFRKADVELFLKNGWKLCDDDDE